MKIFNEGFCATCKSETFELALNLKRGLEFLWQIVVNISIVLSTNKLFLGVGMAQKPGKESQRRYIQFEMPQYVEVIMLVSNLVLNIFKVYSALIYAIEKMIFFFVNS